MIGQDLTGVSFLDSFGGSGIMGMEAWSRGADPVLITEKNPRTVQQIRTQLTIFRPISTQCCDAIKGMKGDWDIVFLDPPYHFDIHPALSNFTNCLVDGHRRDLIIIAPNLYKLQALMAEKGWKVSKQKHYGASTITIFQRNTSA